MSIKFGNRNDMANPSFYHCSTGAQADSKNIGKIQNDFLGRGLGEPFFGHKEWFPQKSPRSPHPETDSRRATCSARDWQKRGNSSIC